MWLLLVVAIICIAGSIALGFMESPKSMRGLSRLVWVRSYEGRWGSLRFRLLIGGLALAASSGVVEVFGLSLGSFVRAMLATLRHDFVLGDWLWVLGTAVGSLILIIVATGNYDEPATTHESDSSVRGSHEQSADDAKNPPRGYITRRALEIIAFPLVMTAFMIILVAGGKLGVL